DAWLLRARFVKTRVRAAALVQEGHVRINRQPTAKPHALLRPGDVLTLPLGRAVRVIAVKALADRRGPAAAAAVLYEEIPEAPALREAAAAGIEPDHGQTGEPTGNAR
ncbi:MAG: RNA-binding S4 domain-containing protein, partial [Acetobacteraceae bacterium]